MEYRTKEEQVADYLCEGIISGRFSRGARLKQTEIAQELKISITPVREALKLLEAEGYLASDSYRGATVAPFDVSASTETLKLRITLETQLVESAVRNVATNNIAELRDLADPNELFLCGVSTNELAQESRDREYVCKTLGDCCADAAIKKSDDVTFSRSSWFQPVRIDHLLAANVPDCHP